MKKLGLIGGTGPESTIEYYRSIEYGVQKRLNSQILPPLCIESLSAFEIFKFCKNGDFDGLCEYLLKGLANLKNAGCEFGAFTGMTPHRVFDKIAPHSPLPLVSMLQTSCEFAKNSGFKKVGLFGTATTMRESFFKDAFEAIGIEVVLPSGNDREFLESKIEHELEIGIINPKTRTALLEIIAKMAQLSGIEALVLGCTELPILLSQNAAVPYIDVMKIHIENLIDKIVE